MDTVFRTKTENSAPSVEGGLKVPEKETGVSITKIDPPYLDYEREHGHPHSVDYFKLGDSWKEPIGGFPEELSLIEEYLQNQIVSGEMANSITAVREKLKGIEKMTNTKSEERVVLKIGKIAAYVKFLMETDDIEHNIKRYANTK